MEKKSQDFYKKFFGNKIKQIMSYVSYATTIILVVGIFLKTLYIPTHNIDHIIFGSIDNKSFCGNRYFFKITKDYLYVDTTFKSDEFINEPNFKWIKCKKNYQILVQDQILNKIPYFLNSIENNSKLNEWVNNRYYLQVKLKNESYTKIIDGNTPSYYILFFMSNLKFVYMDLNHTKMNYLIY